MQVLINILTHLSL